MGGFHGIAQPTKLKDESIKLTGQRAAKEGDDDENRENSFVCIGIDFGE